MGNRTDRILKIKRKYGNNVFKRWGELGGNELLIAQGRGDTITVRRKHRKS